jgi:hypothetical protein
MSKSLSLEEITKSIQAKTAEIVNQNYAPRSIPTGIQEEPIIAVGSGLFEVVNFQCPNKVGKSHTGANILKNIIWDHDPEYYDYPLYQNWPYIDEDGSIIKRARILCTAQNAQDNGVIRKEITKWWPAGRYEARKGGKNFYCIYETDTGWFIDVMTYEQDPSEQAGPLISFQWCDEPPKLAFMGEMMARFSQGGVLLLTQTPVPGQTQFLDYFEEREKDGLRVKHIFANMWDNCSDHKIGKVNSKGTKAGLMTEQQIIEYKRKIPSDELPARFEGKNVSKSGRIYSDYSDTFHVRAFELDSEESRQWNCFCTMDPHQQRYPAIQFWAMTPPDSNGESKHICYNEWPTLETLGGYYYERHNTVCNLNTNQISNIIKVMSGQMFGLHMFGYAMDPRYGRNYRSVAGGGDVQTLMASYASPPNDIRFQLPEMGFIEEQRDTIRKLLKIDEVLVSSGYHDPKILICPWCHNTRKALMSHFWEVGTNKENETHKDFIDAMRIYFAFIKDKEWQPVSKLIKKPIDYRKIQEVQNKFTSALKAVSLG